MQIARFNSYALLFLKVEKLSIQNYTFLKAYYIGNPLYEDEVKWRIKTDDFGICIHFNVPLFSSLHTILSEEKPFNSGYHVVVDNKI